MLRKTSIIHISANTEEHKEHRMIHRLCQMLNVNQWCNILIIDTNTTMHQKTFWDDRTVSLS